MLRKPQGMVILGEARSNHKEVHLEGIKKSTGGEVRWDWLNMIELIKRLEHLTLYIYMIKIHRDTLIGYKCLAIFIRYRRIHVIHINLIYNDTFDAVLPLWVTCTTKCSFLCLVCCRVWAADPGIPKLSPKSEWTLAQNRNGIHMYLHVYIYIYICDSGDGSNPIIIIFGE